MLINHTDLDAAGAIVENDERFGHLCNFMSQLHLLNWCAAVTQLPLSSAPMTKRISSLPSD